MGPRLRLVAFTHFRTGFSRGGRRLCSSCPVSASASRSVPLAVTIREGGALRQCACWGDQLLLSALHGHDHNFYQRTCMQFYGEVGEENYHPALTEWLLYPYLDRVVQTYFGCADQEEEDCLQVCPHTNEQTTGLVFEAGHYPKLWISDEERYVRCQLES